MMKICDLKNVNGIEQEVFEYMHLITMKLVDLIIYIYYIYIYDLFVWDGMG